MSLEIEVNDSFSYFLECFEFQNFYWKIERNDLSNNSSATIVKPSYDTFKNEIKLLVTKKNEFAYRVSHK